MKITKKVQDSNEKNGNPIIYSTAKCMDTVTYRNELNKNLLIYRSLDERRRNRLMILQRNLPFSPCRIRWGKKWMNNSNSTIDNFVDLIYEKRKNNTNLYRCRLKFELSELIEIEIFGINNENENDKSKEKLFEFYSFQDDESMFDIPMKYFYLYEELFFILSENNVVKMKRMIKLNVLRKLKKGKEFEKIFHFSYGNNKRIILEISKIGRGEEKKLKKFVPSLQTLRIPLKSNLYKELVSLFSHRRKSTRTDSEDCRYSKMNNELIQSIYFDELINFDRIFNENKNEGEWKLIFIFTKLFPSILKNFRFTKSSMEEFGEYIDSTVDWQSDENSSYFCPFCSLKIGEMKKKMKRNQMTCQLISLLVLHLEFFHSRFLIRCSSRNLTENVCLIFISINTDNNNWQYSPFYSQSHVHRKQVEMNGYHYTPSLIEHLLNIKENELKEFVCFNSIDDEEKEKLNEKKIEWRNFRNLLNLGRNKNSRRKQLTPKYHPVNLKSKSISFCWISPFSSFFERNLSFNSIQTNLTTFHSANPSICNNNNNNNKKNIMKDDDDDDLIVVMEDKGTRNFINVGETNEFDYKNLLSLNKSIENEERIKVTENVRNDFYELHSNRIFYHTQSHDEYQIDDMNYDSDDNVQPDWLEEQEQILLNDFKDVNDGEKKMMLLWNGHMTKQNIIADHQIPLAALSFLCDNIEIIIEQSIQRNCILHFTQLFNIGLISNKQHFQLINLLQQMEERQLRHYIDKNYNYFLTKLATSLSPQIY
ncbi:hypothetical protein SNEBB_006705 [Seison nebaliae]|nr:hypothetical protein SNEBB_006705 [Seison nebaliae]